MMESVLHKELEYKEEKLKYKIKVLGHEAEDQNQINFLPMKRGVIRGRGTYLRGEGGA